MVGGGGRRRSPSWAPSPQRYVSRPACPHTRNSTDGHHNNALDSVRFIPKSARSTLAPGQLTPATLTATHPPHGLCRSCPLVQAVGMCCSPAFCAGTRHQTGWETAGACTPRVKYPLSAPRALQQERTRGPAVPGPSTSVRLAVRLQSTQEAAESIQSPSPYARDPKIVFLESSGP